MAIKRGSFPYPVLDWTDDVDSTFKLLNVTKSPSTEDIVVRFDLETDDPDLWASVDSGELRIEFRVTCNATMLAGVLQDLTILSSRAVRRSYETSIPQDLVSGQVDIEIIVVAATSLQNFSWSKQHADYGGEEFEVDAGDVLAQAPLIKISAKKLYDPMNGPVGACFEFVEQPAQKRGMRVDLSHDEVVKVELATSLHSDLAQFSHRPQVLIAMIVLPALAETLGQLRLMRDDHDSVADSSWYQSLDRMLYDRTNQTLLSEFEVLKTAQLLLEQPVDAAMKDLNTMEDDE